MINTEIQEFSKSNQIDLVCLCNNDNINTIYKIIDHNFETINNFAINNFKLTKAEILKLSYTILIVFALIITIMIIVKIAINCAIRSRNELARMRDHEGQIIADTLVRKTSFGSKAED